MRKMSALLWAAGIVGLQAINAHASLVLSSSGTNAVSGSWLWASASFELIQNGKQLQLTLSNLGGPVHDGSDILTAVFFDIRGVSTLTPVSAVLGNGSTLLNGSLAAKETLGDHWEYLSHLSGVPGNPSQGISAVGLGIFGQGNFGSHGKNLQGTDFGIINGTGTAGNGHIPSMQLANNSMVFTLSGLPTNFSLDAIRNVAFQFGSALAPTDPMLPVLPVPEPSAFALLALGSTALLLGRWSKR